MSQLIAWVIVLFAFVLPLVHVAFTRAIETRPDNSTCPFSPRVGWIVMVLFLGPFGWFLFMHARHRRPKVRSPASS